MIRVQARNRAGYVFAQRDVHDADEALALARVWLGSGAIIEVLNRPDNEPAGR